MKTLCNNPEEQLTSANGGLKDKSLVFVKGKNGEYLMPCTPAKARKLLKQGKAKSIKRIPFTIQLLFACENEVQDITVGIDKGSSITGFACICNGKVLLGGEIHHRKDIKEKMDARRGCRRARRNRKWYRKPRFSNRASSNRLGRIPPSVKANVEEVIRVIKKIPLPVKNVEIEDVQVDIARLNNPELQGKDYQKSNRLDENIRIATLMRDKYKCVNCNNKTGKLHAHHVVFRSQGGKDTIDNLVALCEGCHKKIHEGKLKLDFKGKSNKLDVISQRSMRGKTYMYKELSKYYKLGKVFGYETSEHRKELNLEKSHIIDAMCIATLRNKSSFNPILSNVYKINFRAKQTRKQYYTLPKKGKDRVRYQVNKSLMGFKKGDLVMVNGYLKVIYSIYSNGYLAFARVKGEPSMSSISRCKLIEKCKTIQWGTMQ
jgi:5-methylcytosine-specific restriction endonuclease McrA